MVGDSSVDDDHWPTSTRQRGALNRHLGINSDGLGHVLFAFLSNTVCPIRLNEIVSGCGAGATELFLRPLGSFDCTGAVKQFGDSVVSLAN